MEIPVEVAAPIITGAITIAVSVVGVWKSMSVGFEKRMKEMNDHFDRSMVDMNARFEKNIDKLYDLSESQMVGQAELRTEMANVKLTIREIM